MAGDNFHRLLLAIAIGNLHDAGVSELVANNPVTQRLIPSLII